MFTVCPKCALTLVVTAADLRVAQGYVRCGRCSSVFNALAQLSDERSAAPAAAPEATSAEPEAEEPESAAPAATDEESTGSAAPAAADEESTGSVSTAVADDDTIPEYTLEFNPETTDASSLFVVAAPSPEWTAATGSFKALVATEPQPPAAAEPEPAAAKPQPTAAKPPPAAAKPPPAAAKPEPAAAEPPPAAAKPRPTAPEPRPQDDQDFEVELDAALLSDIVQSELAPEKAVLPARQAPAPAPPQSETTARPPPAAASTPAATAARTPPAAAAAVATTAATASRTPPASAAAAPAHVAKTPPTAPARTPAAPAAPTTAVPRAAATPAAKTPAPVPGKTSPSPAAARPPPTTAAPAAPAAPAKTAAVTEAAATPRSDGAAAAEPQAPALSGDIAFADFEAVAGATDRPAARPQWQWAAGSALLVLILFAQIINHQRDALATDPRFSRSLTAVYTALGVQLTPRWDLRAYDVRQLGATVEPGGTGAITVRASIRNAGTRPQPPPVLRVTLQDRFGNRLASRDVQPHDYLPGGAAPTALLASDQRVDAELAFVDPGASAVGFELDACLPLGGRIVCANDTTAR